MSHTDDRESSMPREIPYWVHMPDIDQWVECKAQSYANRYDMMRSFRRRGYTVVDEPPQKDRPGSDVEQFELFVYEQLSRVRERLYDLETSTVDRLGAVEKKAEEHECDLETLDEDTRQSNTYMLEQLSSLKKQIRDLETKLNAR